MASTRRSWKHDRHVDIRETKRELRARLRAARDALAPADVTSWSAAITAHVRDAAAWRDAEAIAGFVGVRGEPETRPLLEHALAEGKAVWLPRVLGPSELGFVRVRSLGVLAPGGFGLFEPPLDQNDPPLAFAQTDVDVVLVPGLAFASDGARLGFGRGYYDRALAPFAKLRTPVRLGVCFTAFLDREPVPTDGYDVGVHAIATEHGLVACV
jgi:5-formyltetrahydrofolate cyclo-ligase